MMCRTEIPLLSPNWGAYTNRENLPEKLEGIWMAYIRHLKWSSRERLVAQTRTCSREKILTVVPLDMQYLLALNFWPFFPNLEEKIGCSPATVCSSWSNVFLPLGRCWEGVRGTKPCGYATDPEQTASAPCPAQGRTAVSWAGLAAWTQLKPLSMHSVGASLALLVLGLTVSLSPV